ncbi:uncharacterized protein LOC103929471 [Pyrus x bretschneideri]|uniref:uncharacterized protein LOC103929471 n=1 Tax=Pyrus x bretschneideri TaxID=225117 RepID=UPI00202F3BE5|nr:uncharacterized protein LOC103929471 [Pyrus x bretschneideri]
MPQVDLETLVSACAGGSMDRKIACETLADAATAGHGRPEDDVEEPEVPPDLPPESFWLSKDAEYDWFDRNAFYERKDSTKGNSNANNLNSNQNSHSNSNSQRFSMNLKSKAAIIGLPKPQKHNYADTKNRRHCKVGNTRLFPKRSGSVGKSDAPMIEPSSPKVSCMGRVRSKRDRKKRRVRNRHRQSAETSMEKSVKPVSERRKLGFFASFRAIFRHGGHRDKSTKSPFADDLPPRNSSVKSTRARDRAAADDVDSLPRHSVESEPPGLGGMKRFVSGRRSGSWVGEGGIDVA